MDVVIRVINKFDLEVLDFLVEESYALFFSLRGINSLNDEQNEQLKMKLRNLYIDRNNDKDKIYVAYKSGLIVGCAYINEMGYLSDLFVKKEEQNQGIGSLILKEIISKKKSNEEITLNAHFSVVDFYKKLGFKPIEENRMTVKMKR